MRQARATGPTADRRMHLARAQVMLARTPWGVGAALDSDDAGLGRLQPAPASKTSSTAEPIERSPAMFISPLLLASCAPLSIGRARRPNEKEISDGRGRGQTR